MIKEEIRSVNGKLNALTEYLLEKQIGEDVYEQNKKALLLKRCELDERLGAAHAQSDSQAPDNLQKTFEIANQAYSIYKSGFFEEKRRIIRLVTKKCSVTDKQLTLELAVPFDKIRNRTSITGFFGNDSTPAVLPIY
jgi:hypothetical protein